MSGNLTGLKYLHSSNYKLTPKSFYMAVKHNHIECVEYLIKNKCPFESNLYTVAIEHIEIFKMLKKMYDETPHDSLKLLPNIYDEELLVLIIKKNYIDILKLYDNDDDFICDNETIDRIEEMERRNKENGTNYEIVCISYYNDIFGDTLLKSILKYKRSDILNWCYKSDNYLCKLICDYFPIFDNKTYRIDYSQEQFEFFINWFQNRARKEGDSMRLCSYSEILLSDARFYSPLNICDSYYKCKIPIDVDILKVFDNDEIAKCKNIFENPQITYDYDKVVPIIEWLVAHKVDIDMLLIIPWALNSKYHSWIAAVCRKNKIMIDNIVLYCIKFNNVHLLTYLHVSGITLPVNMCEKASGRNSINVLSWAIFHKYRFDYNANAIIAMNYGYLDILKLCYELNYKVTVDDIINQVKSSALANKNMFSWMIGVVDNLDKLALHIVKHDNVEYLKILLETRNRSQISGLSLSISNYSLICDKIKNNIAIYNAKYVCSFLLKYDWWKKHLRETDNILCHNNFQYTAIEYGNIEVLTMVGLHPPKYFKQKYYNDLINHALLHTKYNIIKWINEIKLIEMKKI
jgi:hypothetical protein